MRGILRNSGVLAAVASLFPGFGFAEQPPGMVVGAVGTPSTVARSARAPDISRMPTGPEVMIPKIGPRGETSVDLNVEGPKSIEVQKAGEAATGAVDDEAAFLLPIWDRKFWVMPPGGLTRFLMPARGFINPSATFASNPVIVESG